MPTVAPIAPLPPAPREQWRLGLRSTAMEAPLGTYLGPGEPVSQDLGGVSYTPLTLGNSQEGSFDPCDDTSITFEQRDEPLVFLPWGIYAWEDCANIGANPVDVRARAVDRLERQTSFFTEQVLWTGALDVGTDIETMAAANTPAADNVRLAADSATLIDGEGSHDIVDAFGYINDWAAGQVGGERLWIHVEPRLLPFLAFYGAGFRNSTRDMSENLGDHRIVAGAGYDGSGSPTRAASSGESWIYVTTPVRFIESAIKAPEDPEQFIDRNVNRMRVVATRMVLAEWDLTVHGAIKVCLPAPGPDCSATGS